MAEGEVGEALPEAEEAEEDVDVDVVFLGSPLEAAMREVGGDAMAALSEEDKEVMAAFRKEEEEAEVRENEMKFFPIKTTFWERTF